MGRGRGRPRRVDDQICPVCGLAGYSYRVPSWNSPYKDTAARNFYLRFIHWKRSIKYHYIDKIVKKLQQKSDDVQSASQYNRETGKTRTYLLYGSVLRQYKQTRALPLIIYLIDRMPENFKPWLRKLKRLRLTRQEVKWLLKKETVRTQADARKFIQGLSTMLNRDKRNTFITFGDEALAEMKGMPNYPTSFIREIQGIDTRGVLDEIQIRRKRQEQRI